MADPRIFLGVIFGLTGIAILVAAYRRKLGWLGFVALLGISLTYAFYINSQLVPGLTRMFSSRSLVQRYLLESDEGDPYADCRTWKTRG